MRWLVADSLYCRQALFCSHVDSYSHYLREYGESVNALALDTAVDSGDLPMDHIAGIHDVVFSLDRYAALLGPEDAKRIAQVAAICDPMPWDVRKADGSPAYDLVVSSIPAMVEQARAAGCRAEFQALAFDHRALMCGAGVERDIDCLFVGTVDGNHRKRAEVLARLGDKVTVAPPTFGRDYYRLLSRAKVLVHVGAEWSQGSANALRLFEGGGLGCQVVSDGKWDGPGPRWWWSIGGDEWKSTVEEAAHGDVRSADQGVVLSHHGYHNRIHDLVRWARSL